MSRLASGHADEVRQSRAMTAGEWVSTGEAAEVLAVTMRELYRMVDLGEVRARRRGRTLEVFPWGHSPAVAGGALAPFDDEPDGEGRDGTGVGVVWV